MVVNLPRLFYLFSQPFPFFVFISSFFVSLLSRLSSRSSATENIKNPDYKLHRDCLMEHGRLNNFHSWFRIQILPSSCFKSFAHCRMGRLMLSVFLLSLSLSLFCFLLGKLGGRYWLIARALLYCARMAEEPYEQDKYHGGKNEISPQDSYVVLEVEREGRRRLMLRAKTVMSCSLSFMSLPLVAFPTGFLTHPMSSFFTLLVFGA
ncbi:hypothetical protein BDZ97DRAFT_117347 [Flammula alnicola]|nr:hypothetical protein BDZ97DRAFT_117347 [Flammula alnicola]